MAGKSPYTDEQIHRMRVLVHANGGNCAAAAHELGVSDYTVRKYAKQRSPAKPTASFALPPSHLHGTDRIMDYAPPCSASLGPWLEALPDHQLSAVWKAVTVEQWGECNRADALSILQAVDRRFVKVSTHGRDRTNTRGNADPNRAA